MSRPADRGCHPPFAENRHSLGLKTFDNTPAQSLQPPKARAAPFMRQRMAPVKFSSFNKRICAAKISEAPSVSRSSICFWYLVNSAMVASTAPSKLKAFRPWLPARNAHQIAVLRIDDRVPHGPPARCRPAFNKRRALNRGR